MKRFVALLVFLPSLGACTIENDYYSPEPQGRVRVVTPYNRYHHHSPRYNRHVDPSNHYHEHDEGERITVPATPRRYPYAKRPNNVHGYENRESLRGRDYSPNAHGHD